MHAFDDDQDFFEAILKTAGRHVDFLLRFPWADHGRLARGKPLRKNAIVAGGVKPFTLLDVLFVLHVVDDHRAVALAFKRPVHAVLLRNHAGGESRIGDQQHETSAVGKRPFTLPDDPIRRDHGHAFLDAAGRARGRRSRPLRPCRWCCR